MLNAQLVFVIGLDGFLFITVSLLLLLIGNAHIVHSIQFNLFRHHVAVSLVTLVGLLSVLGLLK